MDSTLPSIIETSRLILRSYREGDENWYFEMSQRNRAHLKRYESQNPAMAIKTKEDAKKMIAALTRFSQRVQTVCGSALRRSY